MRSILGVHKHILSPGMAGHGLARSRGAGRGQSRGVGGEEGAQSGPRTGLQGCGTEDWREKGRDEEKRNLAETYVHQSQM